MEAVGWWASAEVEGGVADGVLSVRERVALGAACEMLDDQSS